MLGTLVGDLGTDIKKISAPKISGPVEHRGSHQNGGVQMCKLLCEHLDKDGVKDIESAVGAVRSDKVKKEREQAAKDKKGALPLVGKYSLSLFVVAGHDHTC